MAYPDNLDYSLDYKVWNEREPVTYFSKVTEAISSATPVTVTDTLWTTIDRDELKADSELSKFTFRVQLPGATLMGITPKTNDLMRRSNGTQWIIQKLEGPDVVDWEVYVTQDFKYNPNLNV